MTRKSSSSEAWELCASDFPSDGTSRERLAFLLRYALLAPSTHNTQPWGFTLGPDRILLFRDRSRWLQVADPTQRELHLSVGCAMENLLIAARAFGYRPQVPHIRARLECLFPLPDVHPQQVFRIGFADRDEVPMPRRNLEELIA
jgi:nitroreductase